MNRLSDYPVDVDAGDLFRHAPEDVAARWVAMSNGLVALSEDAGIPIQELVSRQIQELGLSFRIAGDADERPWPLAPMPLIIGAEEWAQVERGLIQRAALLEAVASDVYGAQTLVSDGALPAAVVTGSRYFARQMVGLKPRGDHFLHVYAVDLARGPLGQWRVIGDRVRLANGIGYALENRLALSRSSGSLLSDINTRRLAQFFTDMREGISRDCQRENPRIALLTPGRFNQSYPEQAHLARYLGFPLVEGRDLTVSDDRLYVRTIAGPKRIDAVWRWIDTNALDPLAFDSRSAIGVPDLFDAWARGGLEMANWPGAEVVESPAFSAFLPRLCRKILGQEPILPTVATWWCGQPGEATTVRSRIDELLIVPAFGSKVEGIDGTAPVRLADLDEERRADLLDAMQRRPMDYCGQEIIQLSTTPALVGEKFEPRPFTLRAFVARGSDGQWRVMPGGFARISSSNRLLSTLMGEGDMSADVCIVEAPGVTHVDTTVLSGVPSIQRGGGILASQTADNLFWFGRYCERAEITTRILRSILGSSIEVDSAAGRNPEVRALLIQMLFYWGVIGEDDKDATVPEACLAALMDTRQFGSVASLLANMQATGLSLRDRFSPDFWRLASRPVPVVGTHRPGTLMRVARELIERLSGISGLIAEDVVRGPVWRFLDLGRRVERALATCRVTRQLSHAEDQADALSVLLDLCDSQITYRSRYLTVPMRDPVLDLVLLDPDNPRSLVFQVATIENHLEALPHLDEVQLPEQPLREARRLISPLTSLTIAELHEDLFNETEARLLALSESIGARYFLQYEKTEKSGRDNLLA